MKSHRTISLTLTLLAVLLGAVPASAPANSLLSGYGGPGEGSQAILGSTLVGGAGGGRGGGGSSGGSSGGSGTSVSEATGTGAQVGRPGATSSNSKGRSSESTAAGGRAARAGAGARAGNGKASGGVARAYPSSSRDDAAPSTSAGSGGLGVSGEDLGYALLVLVGLTFTGVLTRRLARAPVRPEGM